MSIAAAIYARKSTSQEGVEEGGKSVAVQVANARAFAAAKGWTVSAVYTDEAVSGADTKRLVQRERLLTAIRGGAAPFDVLVMRDTSRFSRRDGDEAFTELKQIAQVVDVWFYADAIPRIKTHRFKRTWGHQLDAPTVAMRTDI